VARFFYQTQALLPYGGVDCVEAARRTLGEMGATPEVAGPRVRGLLGSQLKMRIVGGAFCPEKWLPIEVIVDVLDAGANRQVVVSVADRLGFGTMLLMESRYRAHCQQTASYVGATIARRLATPS
jgi:hypothetical protein